MDQYKSFEDVIEYLEEVIMNTSETNYDQIALIVGCPAALFQRIFIFVTGVSIAEYVRRRRLSLAGLALKNSTEKIIDIAIRFGFNSHVAFSRAFREHHEASPSQVRSGAKIHEYSRLSFTNMRIVGGRRIMAEMKRIEYVNYKPRKIVGMMKETNFQEAGEACWGEAFKQGLFNRLEAIEAWRCKDYDDYIGLGHMSQFKGLNDFNYIIGKFYENSVSVPKGMYAEEVHGGTVAKIWIEADTLYNIIESAFLLCSEAIEKTGYKIDYEHFYWCDIYTYQRYCTPQEKGEKLVLDYILPVVKEPS